MIKQRLYLYLKNQKILRLFSNNSNNFNEPKWIQTLNLNLSLYSLTAIPLFVTMRMSSWYFLVYLSNKFFLLGPEYAIGYAVSKLTLKFRSPLNLLLSALISKQFPLLQRIKISYLFNISNSLQNTSSSPPSSPSSPPSYADKLVTWIEEPTNKYGAAYLISGRLTSVSTILLTSYFVRQGVDINTVLSNIGIPDVLQEASGSFAAATLLNSFLLPFHVWYSALFSPPLYRLYILISGKEK